MSVSAWTAVKATGWAGVTRTVTVDEGKELETESV